MKKIFVAVCLVALIIVSTSCGASRRNGGNGCPNNWEGYKYRG